MKIRISLVLSIVLILAAFGNGSVNAQKSQKLRSTPKAFQTYYAKFRVAAIKKDISAVVALTRFPFEYGWDAGDEGTYSKTEFRKKFGDIFGETADLFAQKNPIFYVEQGTYSLTDEETASHFLFKKSGAGYKFTAFIVEP